MKIATWNVNSIRSRHDRLLAWLEKQEPDFLCLQELKATEKVFPFEALREAGYHATAFGQRTYNGVAVLSRAEPCEVEQSFQDGVEDSQARFLSVRFESIRVISVYVPNGSTVGSDKWHYKLEWLRRLRAYLDAHADPAEPLALCGDFNVAPDDRDAANPGVWRDSVLCAEEGREALRRICEWGLTDTFRQLHPEGGFYSWWDYRQLGFPRNDGLRIDHIFATTALAKQLRSAEIDRNERKGKKPSDHAPVVAVFALDQQ